jgi:hypothetical protein
MRNNVIAGFKFVHKSLLFLRGSTVLEETWPPLFFVRFRNKKLLRGGVVSTTPNPQTGGPVDYI